eukprot:m.85524 g.85524  ORF g.85524 m.85524 type:complete len:55 (+) comp12192_c0_seq7:130-294(+)
MECNGMQWDSKQFLIAVHKRIENFTFEGMWLMRNLPSNESDANVHGSLLAHTHR